MQTVWKFPMISPGPAAVRMPKDAQIIHVDRDPATGMVAFWAVVTPENDIEERTFAVAGTGHMLSGGWAHRGSVIIDALVWHLFEAVDAKRLVA